MFQLRFGTSIPFMSHRRIAYLISATLVLVTAAWLIIHQGPRLSVDFTGGTLVQIRTSRSLQVVEIRTALEAAGLRNFEVQQLTGGEFNEFFVRFGLTGTDEPYPLIDRAILSRFPDETVELRRVERIGPSVGRELRSKALWAVIGGLGGILVYVGVRYEFKFACGAVVALFHDVFVTLGILCLLDREISLTVLAALLTIAGFSINDTIVIFDRIRERRKSQRVESHARVMDTAVNETLGRTIITTLMVLFTALSLLLFGGQALRDFSLAIVIGLVLGTYSTIYVASGLVLDTWLWLDRRRAAQRQ